MCVANRKGLLKGEGTEVTGYWSLINKTLKQGNHCSLLIATVFSTFFF